jgi:hypothetical protein
VLNIKNSTPRVRMMTVSRILVERANR